jgi:hypothetical protein
MSHLSSRSSHEKTSEMPLSCIFFIGSPILRKGCTFLFGHRNGKNVGPRDAAWGPVGPSVGQWTCVSRPEATGGLYHKDNDMNEDVFNGSIRKFLKTLGVSGQREIEKAVRQALAEGKLKGNEKFPATGTITLGGIGLSHEIKGEIELE